VTKPPLDAPVICGKDDDLLGGPQVLGDERPGQDAACQEQALVAQALDSQLPVGGNRREIGQSLLQSLLGSIHQRRSPRAVLAPGGRIPAAGRDRKG